MKNLDAGKTGPSKHGMNIGLKNMSDFNVL